jgi:hypothetical protein
MEPVASLLTCEACSPIRVSLQSACQEVPRQPEVFGGFCGSNSDARIPPALRRSWPPQHVYASSLRQAGTVPLSPTKPALPLKTLSDSGRAPIQPTQVMRNTRPLIFSCRITAGRGGPRGVNLSPSLHEVADSSSGNIQLPMSPGWADQVEANDGFALRGGAECVLSTLARVRVRSGGGRPRKIIGDARTALVEQEREFTGIIASWGDPEGTAASESGNTYICGSPGLCFGVCLFGERGELFLSWRRKGH